MLVGALGGIVAGLGLVSVMPITRANFLYATSVMAAVIGTYGTLILLLLVARLPVLERAYGQDRLVFWHKRLAPWALGLVLVHIVLVVASYAADLGTSWWAQLISLTVTTPWILPAVAGTLLLGLAGLTSWRKVRGKIRHETWWTIHLFTYVGILLAFAHQITSGGPFLAGPARALWIALYVAVFGMILWYRVLTPLGRGLWHGIRVQSVIRETPNVVSVVMTGRHIDQLAIAPGQFFSWRFDAPGLRYEAHPYSISGLSRDGRIRITVKALGDASAALATIPAGTRVAIEGPYGALTPSRLSGRRVVAVAGGVGIGPIVSLASGMAGYVPLVVIYRASRRADLALTADLESLGRNPNVTIFELAGSRREYPMDAAMLYSLTGNLDDSDVVICGPVAFTEQVSTAARQLGARPESTHSETFDW